MTPPPPSAGAVAPAAGLIFASRSASDVGASRASVLARGGIVTFAGVGRSAFVGFGAPPPARAVQNAAGSSAPGGGPGGAGPLIGGVAGAFAPPRGFGLGATEVESANRRSRSSSESAAAFAELTSAAPFARVPPPPRDWDSSLASAPRPTPRMDLSWAPASMDPRSGAAAAAAAAGLLLETTLPTMAPGRGFPSVRAAPPVPFAAAPLPLPAPANPRPPSGIFGPAAAVPCSSPPAPGPPTAGARPGRSAAAIARTPLPPPLPSLPSHPPLVTFPFLSRALVAGAASPSCGMAGGCERFTSCATGSIAPRFSGRTPCRSVAPTKSRASNITSAASPCVATTKPRVPKGGDPPSPTIATRSPSSKSPPAYRSMTSPCVTGRISNRGETPSSETGSSFASLASLTLCPPTAAWSAFMAASGAILENLLTSGFLALGAAFSHALSALSAGRRAASGTCFRATSSSRPSNPPSGSLCSAANTHPCARLYSCISWIAPWP